LKYILDILKARLIEQVPELKTVDLFNNQYARSNNDNTEENTQEAFDYPSCFISFEDITWSGTSSGAQKANLIVRLHIGYSNLMSSLGVFDLVSDIHVALQGFGDPTSKFQTLKRESERPNYDHNNVYVYEVDYRTAFLDDSTYNRKPYTPISDVELELQPDLKIDYPVIRTGKID
jgi:hypothetical protein